MLKHTHTHTHTHMYTHTHMLALSHTQRDAVWVMDLKALIVKVCMSTPRVVLESVVWDSASRQRVLIV